jgi:hypothetical protein
VKLSRPGRSGGDEPGFEEIRGWVYKWRALNTRLSSGRTLLQELSHVPRGFTEIAEAKNEPNWYFELDQKKDQKTIHSFQT